MSWAMELTEAQLQRFRAGDQEVFAQVVACYQTGIYNLAVRMVGDRTEAWDLTQEVFLRAYRKAALYDPQLPLKPWLYQLATRVVLNACDRRRRRPDQRAAAPTNELPASSSSPTTTIVRDERDRDLQRAMAAIAGSDRIALQLRYLGELSLAEVACALGLTIQATKTRLFRARMRLKAILEEQDSHVLDDA
jgi:RNA polymerase sigma-70 factor (ECF subfamily)